MAPITGVKKYTKKTDEIFADTIHLPTMLASEFIATEHDLDGLSLDKLKRTSLNAMAISALGYDSANYPGLFENRKTSDFLKSKTDEEIKTTYPVAKSKKGKLAKRGAKGATRRALGMQSIKQIVLPHSGFRITVDAIPRVDRFVLLEQLAEHEIELSTDTATMIYATPRIIYVRLLMEFISEFIIDTTLNLEENDDILDYINVLDIDVLVLEIVKSFYNEGFAISIACKNSTTLDGDDVKCAYVITGKVNLNEVYKFDEDALSDEQLDILSRRGSGTVSIEEQASYMDELTLNDSSKVIKLERDENVIELELHQSTVKTYMVASDKYTSEINRQVDKVLMGDESPLARKSKLESIAKDMVLAKYMHFVSSVTVNGDKTTDISSIYDALSVIMDDDEYSATVIKELVRFLDSHICAMTCTPVYTCPSCRKVSSPNGSGVKGFGSMIPLDILEVFTALRSKSL